MSTEGFVQAASAVARRITGRAARGTAFIRQRKSDTSLKSLEATRVFVSAIFRDISAARASAQWIEPMLFVPVVPTIIPKVRCNELGVRIADPDDDSTTTEGTSILPGRMVAVIAPEGSRVVEVSGLAGIGSDWGSWDLIDELNELCFPEDLLPDANPDWLDQRDPRHQNLFANLDAHLTAVANGRPPQSPERYAAEAARLALVRGRSWYLNIFDELAKQATNERSPIPFGPVETMWCAQLGMEFPEWAVRYDATRDTTRVSAAERAVERMAELFSAQATAAPAAAPTPQALLDRMEQIAAENAELRAMLQAQQPGVTPEAPAATTEAATKTEDAPAAGQPATNRKRN